MVRPPRPARTPATVRAFVLPPEHGARGPGAYPELRAEVCGPLALCPVPWFGSGPYWSLVMVKTGAIVARCPRRASALKALRIFLAEVPAHEWDVATRPRPDAAARGLPPYEFESDGNGVSRASTHDGWRTLGRVHRRLRSEGTILFDALL